MRGLSIKDLNKIFSTNCGDVTALKDINLDVKKGEFVTILGHSGCGKSTLLKIIAGLESASSGSITYSETKISGPGTDRGMVFQEHRLLPWLTIDENVGFGLINESRAVREKLVTDHLKMVKLDGFHKAYPHQLSGGMAQRAAIARGLVNNPEILLLDEPFGALDALTRIQMQKEILKIWESEKTTMIMVTHDIDEAIYLGQRIVVMSAGPGKIRSVINGDSYESKDRGSLEFARIKKQILGYFFEEENINPEYMI
ncbi:ABC transporter ATP-binding protein [Alkalibacter saccharofermentans]|uniref:Sulfonate transport system ATP-binding protein n=1 Tax=Alkalibacter saccharofermentans DSM 14828 TaxID=1120975 RepID=A0A1M4Z9N8_9FIRM|nr:ABC transporter ATP-binding protein [Alkalibacter saccharofermentans]SHF14658.1 sulfonate transport system ATP-binding protein [Alkalibacter saccharofermentans DSM 14828]